ncbi:MAG: polysaccharide biosynthesis C-terminal domain-containing protein [Coriobacteriia bacterium]
MKVLVTGSAGFIGRNLIERLKTGACPEVTEIFEYDRDTDPDLLPVYAGECDFIFHLAGVNRPQDPIEFTEGNVDFTVRLLDALRASTPRPVAVTSSVQAVRDNPYGLSKRGAEDAVAAYSAETGAPAFVYRLPNVFGKWSRPNYNTVVATFCHNIARDVPIEVSDPSAPLTLVYIDDVVDEFLRALNGRATEVQGQYVVPVTHETTVGELAERLLSFRQSRDSLAVPRSDDPLERKLYATYLSFLEPGSFSYPLTMHTDQRGSFTEIIRTAERGQFSVNVIKPGITKGNHWHDTKNEKFAVVSGAGVIRFRKVGESEIHEYLVSGEKIEVVDIPPGYTHNIENLGDTDMVTFMWASEAFDPDRPDTYPLPVKLDDR